MGTKLYFQATDGSTGNELWAHETTNGATWQADDIMGGSSSSSPDDFTPMGDQLYFSATCKEGNYGKELCVYGVIEHSITYG